VTCWDADFFLKLSYGSVHIFLALHSNTTQHNARCITRACVAGDCWRAAMTRLGGSLLLLLLLLLLLYAHPL
jgi:hypothetical protein